MLFHVRTGLVKTTAAAAGKHVIAALVQNESGVLAGVSNMFAGRGYNIDSLVVGRTEIEDLSRQP